MYLYVDKLNMIVSSLNKNKLFKNPVVLLHLVYSITISKELFSLTS